VCVQLTVGVGRRSLLQIEERVPQVNPTLAEKERKAFGMTPNDSRA
jgi:hypothetical protein